jgi:hypothetical protein
MAERLMVSRYSATQFAFPHESLLDGLERLARFIASLVQRQRVVEVLPKLAVLLEIDLHSDLPALRVGDEMNALHGFSLPFAVFNAIHPLVHVPNELSLAAEVTAHFIGVYA